jgi:hypothetical protein
VSTHPNRSIYYDANLCMDKKQDHGKNEFYNYFDLVFYKK